MAYRRRVADLRIAGWAERGRLKGCDQRYAATINSSPSWPPPRGRRAVPASAAPSRTCASAVARRAPWKMRRCRKACAVEVRQVQHRAGGACGVVVHPRQCPASGFLDGLQEVNAERSIAYALRQDTRARVAAILSGQVSRELSGVHWEYGPSWVRFECGQVVDWYSSPLNPLKASRSCPCENCFRSAGARAHMSAGLVSGGERSRIGHPAAKPEGRAPRVDAIRHAWRGRRRQLPAMEHLPAR